MTFVFEIEVMGILVAVTPLSSLQQPLSTGGHGNLMLH